MEQGSQVSGAVRLLEQPRKMINLISKKTWIT